ncbi:MAG: hypothetical protein J6L64_07895 [Opitutales bacterium]|nr:hypothetical protein [Opitutales bacterium]
MTKKTANPNARYGNKNALKPPEERRVRVQFSLHRDDIAVISEIRAETGETASAVVARAVAELKKKLLTR